MCSEILQLKDTEIVVTVIEVIQDLLVVSYVFGSRNFQGVLMDSKKGTPGNPPCGIKLSTAEEQPKAEDALRTVINERFTYFQNLGPLNGISKNWSSKKGKNKNKPTRMTVRLRPRQVLCSKCKSVCGDNNLASESQVKNKNCDKENNSASQSDSALNEPANETSISKYNLRNKSPCSPKRGLSLIPKVPRLRHEDLTSVTNKDNSSGVTLDHMCHMSPRYSIIGSLNEDTKHFSAFSTSSGSGSEADSLPVVVEDNANNITDGKKHRKQHNGSASRQVGDWSAPSTSNCYAAQEPVVEHEMLSDNSGGTDKMEVDEMVSEMEMETKKLGKNARKRSNNLVRKTEEKEEDIFKRARTTPVLKISFGTEGQGTVFKIPSKIKGDVSESEDEHSLKEDCDKYAKRAKRKARKKKKKKKKFCSSPTVGQDVPLSNSQTSKVKNGRKDHKLSISLKRLGANAYTARCIIPEQGSQSDSSEEVVGECDDSIEAVDTDLRSYTSNSGDHIEVGDVIWGPVNGSRWWPGKVLNFRISAVDENVLYALISWFGSSSSTLMNCEYLSPFLETYKVHFSRKHRKSNHYREAIRQANDEAEQIKLQKMSEIAQSHAINSSSPHDDC